MKRKILNILATRLIYVRFVHIRKWGYCKRPDQEVLIRKRLAEEHQIRTLVHEHIHYLRPSWSEEKVLEMEETIISSLHEAEYEEVRTHLRFWKQL